MKIHNAATRSILLALSLLTLSVNAFANGTAESPSAPSSPPILSAADQALWKQWVVDAEWLSQNLDKVVVVDARPKAEYDAGHIPGAVHAVWQDWANMSVKQGEAGWSVILSPEVLAEKLAALGIDGSKPVITYDDPVRNGAGAGRQLWALRTHGIKNSFILNGGITRWDALGYPKTTEKTVITPVAPARTTPDLSLFASTDYLAQAIAAQKRNFKVFDARDDQEYAGVKNSGEGKNGRIPGSVHIWYKDLYNADGTIPTPTQLRARFEALGLRTTDEIVAYCTGGIRSGTATIFLKLAGYQQVRNYDASFSEWANNGQVIDTAVIK